MDIAQFYDTTLTDCESGLAVRVIVVPNRSMAPYVQGDLVEWAVLLDLRSIAFLESADEMVAVLASIVDPNDPEARRLAGIVVGDPRIPFLNSELRMLSLGEIALSANVPLSAVVSLVASPESKLLLVAVPDGVVVCGGVAAMAGALESGLCTRIREVMGLDGPKFRSTGPAAHN